MWERARLRSPRISESNWYLYMRLGLGSLVDMIRVGKWVRENVKGVKRRKEAWEG